MDDDRHLDGVAREGRTAVGAGIARLSAVEDFSWVCHRGHSQHVGARVRDQTPDALVQLIAIPVAACDGETVVSHLVAPGVGGVADVDQEEHAALTGDITGAGHSLEGIVCGDEAVVPRGYDEVAPAVLLTERGIVHAVLHAVGHVEVRNQGVRDVRERLPELGGRVHKAIEPCIHDRVVGDVDLVDGPAGARGGHVARVQGSSDVDGARRWDRRLSGGDQCGRRGCRVRVGRRVCRRRVRGSTNDCTEDVRILG